LIKDRDAAAEEARRLNNAVRAAISHLQNADPLHVAPLGYLRTGIEDALRVLMNSFEKA